jgi:hypothetical protein
MQKVKKINFLLFLIKMKIIAFLNELLKHSRETLELPTYLLLGNDTNRTEKMTKEFFEKKGSQKSLDEVRCHKQFHVLEPNSS